VTCGKDVRSIVRMVEGYGLDFGAEDVMAMMSGPVMA